MPHLPATPRLSMLATAEFLRLEGKTGDVLIDIQVMPNATQTRTDGLYGEPGLQALKIRLKAAPVEGQANDALIKWLAKQLGLAQRDLVLVRGATARRKQLRVSASAAQRADWAMLMPPIPG